MEAKDLEALEGCLGEGIEEPIDDHPMNKLEELRRFLDSFLRPEVLQAFLNLKKEMGDFPKQYNFFYEHGVGGDRCRYALAVLEKFKKQRLDKVKELLVECNEKVKDL